MREIKFRVLSEGKVYDCPAINYHNMTALSLPEGCSIYSWCKVEQFLQYTGLKDCKGKEIYEGDILELKAQGSGYAVFNWVAVVEFGNPNGEYNWGWQLKPIKGVGINPDILLWVETEMPNVRCEVIGNIYETPELLEGENG